MKLSSTPSSALELLDQAFQLYRRHGVTLCGLAAVVVLPYMLVMGVGLQLLLGDDFILLRAIQHDPPLLLQHLSNETMGPVLGGLASLALGYGVLYGLIIPLAAGATYLYLDGLLHESPGTLRSSFVELATLLPAYLLLLVLKWGVISAGYVMLLFPGVLAAVLLSQAELMVLLEGVSGWTAMKRSLRVMEEGAAMLRFVGLWLALFVITFVIVTVSGLVLEGMLGLGASAVVKTLLDGLLEVALLPLSVGARLLFYYDLQVRKEGLDIEHAALSLAREEAWDRDPQPPGMEPTEKA